MSFIKYLLYFFITITYVFSDSKDIEEYLPEEKKKQISQPIFVQTTLNFSSTYFWRGRDVYLNKFYHDNQDEKVYNNAWSAMPEITFYAPFLQGLFVNLWSAVPVANRQEKNNTAGLKKNDEINLTANYSFTSSKYGTAHGGLITYIYPTAGVNYLEPYIGYTAPILLSPTIKTYFADHNGGSTIYTTFDINYPFIISFNMSKLESSLTITPSFLAAIWICPASSGTNPNFAHFDFKVPVSFNITNNVALLFTPVFSYRLYQGGGKQVPSITNPDVFIGKNPIKIYFTLGVTASF